MSRYRLGLSGHEEYASVTEEIKLIKMKAVRRVCLSNLTMKRFLNFIKLCWRIATINISTNYFSIAAILIFFSTLAAGFLWERQKIESLSDEQRIRLETVNNQLRFANTHIANAYNFDFLPQCDATIKYLTDNKLNLRVDTRTKVISENILINSLNIDSNSKIVRLNARQKQMETDIEFYRNISISEKNSEYTLDYDGKNANARPLDFQLLIKLPSGSHCVQTLRLFFSNFLDASGKWRVKSSIGRGGLNIGEFSLPYGTEFYEGRLWTTDCSNENISVFNLDGEFVDSFSQFGSGLGKLDTPADMKIFDNKMYVVEERNHRVQVFSLSGDPLFLFGSYKETDDPHLFTDKFNNPLGISVTEDLIVVVDYGNNRILAYDDNFNHVWTSGNETGDQFDWDNPYYIEYSKKHDHYLVSNQTKSNIGILSRQGKKIGTIGEGILATPFEIAITKNGDALVADTIKKQVVIFDGEKNYAVKDVIKFGDTFGIPKTVTALSENKFLVGFVGNGPAYFLYLEDSETRELSRQPKSLRPSFVKAVKAKQFINPKQGPGNPKWVYSTYCASCHEAGIYNAPARGNIEAWDRFPRELDELLHLAKVGNGAMISKGGCTECTDKQLAEAIKILLPRTWIVEQ